MKNKLLTFAGALVVTAALGHFYAKPLLAQVRAALVQDVDQPARAPFQALLIFGSSGLTNVTIPPGQRLVVDFITVGGAANAPGGGTQPTIALGTTVGSGQNSRYAFAPQQSGTVGGVFNLSEPVTIYADSLEVDISFSGSIPSFAQFAVGISGHLIKP